MKITIKKGYRKVFVCIIGFVWAVVVGILFKDYSAVLIPCYSFGSSIVLYLFAANYGEHREENRSNYGEINQEEYHGE